MPCKKTENCKYAAIENEEKKIYGLQYHAEVNHTEEGKKSLKTSYITFAEQKAIGQ